MCYNICVIYALLENQLHKFLLHVLKSSFQLDICYQITFLSYMYYQIIFSLLSYLYKTSSCGFDEEFQIRFEAAPLNKKLLTKFKTWLDEYIY